MALTSKQLAFLLVALGYINVCLADNAVDGIVKAVGWGLTNSVYKFLCLCYEETGNDVYYF